MLPRLITVEQVAELLGVCKSTIRNRANGLYFKDGKPTAYAGKNPFPKGVKVCGRLVFRESDIEGWMRNNLKAAV